MNYRGNSIKLMILNFWHDEGRPIESGIASVALLQRFWAIFRNLVFALACSLDDWTAYKEVREPVVLQDLQNYLAPEWRTDDRHDGTHLGRKSYATICIFDGV